jgi:hypothetical protein
MTRGLACGTHSVEEKHRQSMAGKLEGKRALGKSRFSREDYIKMDLVEIG